MINIKHGDLLQSNATYLVNTVNCVGVMGKGIALQFKNKYPEMFKEYRKSCKQGGIQTGKLWIWRETCQIWEKRILHNIICFPTKQHWMNPSKLEWIESGLQWFVDNYKKRGIKSVAFPKLGCNNGGLNWETQVKPLMIKYLEPLDIDIEIYE